MAEVSTQQPSVAPRDLPDFKIVGRLDNVPVIHDSVAYAHQLINSTSLTTSLFNAATAVAKGSYNLASPVLSAAKPIIDSADGLAVATVDRAESIVPYPFKTPTEDLIVVKQAKGIYDARLAPLIHSQIVQDVVNRVAEVNSALGARAQSTIKSSAEVSQALVDQLKTLTAHGSELPGDLYHGLGKVTADVKQIAFDKDASAGDKGKKLQAYVIDNVKPVVDQIYEYLLGAKRRAEQEASHAAGKAIDTAESVSQQVSDKAQEVGDKAQQASGSGQ